MKNTHKHTMVESKRVRMLEWEQVNESIFRMEFMYPRYMKYTTKLHHIKHIKE